MSKTVLVVAAHADDEALGCGGTIARHVAEGDTVHLVLMADGVKSRTGADEAALIQRDAAADQAHANLKIKSVHRLGFPDNRMDSLTLLEIVQALEPVIARIVPQVIYTHHCGDLNVDHRLTHQAVITACRPLPGSSVREIYGFEVLSSTEWSVSSKEVFVPNLFVDISAHLATKQRTLEAYNDEMRSVPHTRSIEHAILLAKHRGYSVGVGAAEAFEVYRCIR